MIASIENTVPIWKYDVIYLLIFRGFLLYFPLILERLWIRIDYLLLFKRIAYFGKIIVGDNLRWVIVSFLMENFPNNNLNL